MAQRYEYHVHTLPGSPQAIEALLNMEGEEGFEVAMLSFTEGTAVFQKDIYVERRSEEHIDTVLKAVKSYGDVRDLEFLLDERATDSDIPTPRVLADDDAWRFLINRILGES